MKYQIIYNILALNKIIILMRNAGSFVFNLEINNINYFNDDLLGISFLINPGKVIYLPLNNNFHDTCNQINHIQALKILKPILEDSSIAKIGYNLKVTFSILKKHNIRLSGKIYDIMLESYVINNTAKKHDITSLADYYLQDRSDINFKEVFSEKIRVHYDQSVIIDNIAKYINIISLVHQKIWPKISKQHKLKKIFEEIDIPLISVLSRIEENGVLIDNNILINYLSQLTQYLDLLEIKIFAITKERFNLLSTKQLRTILYKKQKLPILKITSTGMPSTSELILNKLSLEYTLPKLILNYRSLIKHKLIISQLLNMINIESNRIHTSYHQTITTTGRLSSSKPNLQNIPILHHNNIRIRQAFIAPLNKLIVSADYSQIELRIIAHLSHDPTLIKAFHTNKDIHCITAAEIFNTIPSKINLKQRRIAKIINFGLIYGMSIFGVANQLSISFAEAKCYIDCYFKHYPGVLEYIKYVQGQANKNGYVTTIDGRRLNLINNKSKKYIERVAINAPIQGTAADIIKRAMINIDSWIQKESIPIRIILQIHDELVFEVPDNILDYIKINIKKIMESCFVLDVPLKVNIGIGKNWDQVH